MKLAAICIVLCLGLAVQGRPQGTPEQPTAHGDPIQAHPLPGSEGSLKPADHIEIKEVQSGDNKEGKPAAPVKPKDSSEEDGSADEAGRKRRQTEEEHKTPAPTSEGLANPHSTPVTAEKVDEKPKPANKESSKEEGSSEEAGRKRRQTEEAAKTPLPGGEGSVNPANKPVIVEKVDETKPVKKDSSEEDGSGSAEEAGRKKRQTEEAAKTPLPGGEGSVHKPEVHATKVESAESAEEKSSEEITTTKKSA